MNESKWETKLTVTCIVIAAIFEAVEQALAGSPSLKGALTAGLPTFLLSPRLHYVPLSLLTVAGLVWLYGKYSNKAAAPTAQVSPQNVGSADDTTLVQRLLRIVEELKQFLNELGPELEVVYRPDMSAEEFNKANQQGMIRSRKMEAMFIRRFQSRVIDIYNEACELGTIHDAELEHILRTKRPDTDDVIRTYIDRMAAIAADVAVKQPSRV